MTAGARHRAWVAGRTLVETGQGPLWRWSMRDARLPQGRGLAPLAPAGRRAGAHRAGYAPAPRDHERGRPGPPRGPRIAVHGDHAHVCAAPPPGDPLRGLPAGEDRVPPAHTGMCRQAAEGIDPSTGQVVHTLLEGPAQYQLRSAQAILALADKHGLARLEAPCAKALLAGDPAYRTIRNILAAGLEAAELPERTGGDGGAPAFLHGPDQLFGNVIRFPRTNPPADDEAAP